MTNRNFFNRKFVKRTKTLRDRKKAQSVGNKRKEKAAGVTINVNLSKKRARREERLEKIYQKEGIKNTKVLEKKEIKRRNRSGKYCTVKEEGNEMNID